MSRVSEISRQYHAALTASQAEYEALSADRRDSTEEFYDEFFRNLVWDFSERFRDERLRARLQERIERVIGTSTLQFVAIDGSCRREIGNRTFKAHVTGSVAARRSASDPRQPWPMGRDGSGRRLRCGKS